MAWQVLHALPSPISAARAERQFSGLGEKKILLLCVYRERNARTVSQMLRGIGGVNVDARLWALDSVAPELEEHTRGIGPGARCELLNRLMHQSADVPDWLVVIDDDVNLLKSWTIPSMIGAMSMLSVDFAQPAHVVESSYSHAFNFRRPLLAGRRVCCVEIGPLFIVRKPWIDRVVPFPKDAGMGFFLEWEWADLVEEGCRSAVLDCVPMRHFGTVGADYGAVALGRPRHPKCSEGIALDQFVAESHGYGRALWPTVVPFRKTRPISTPVTLTQNVPAPLDESIKTLD